MPSISYVDNADGTGLTATVSGAGSTEVVRIYTAPFSGAHNLPADWMERGNRVGNGTVSVAVGPGHYFDHDSAVIRSRHQRHRISPLSLRHRDSSANSIPWPQRNRPGKRYCSQAVKRSRR